MRQCMTKMLLIALLLSVMSCAARTRAIDPRVTIIEPRLGRNLIVTNVIAERDSGGLLEVQVDGMSYFKGYLNLEYRIDWLDQNGMLIPTTITQWTKFPAFQHAEFRFRTIAPSKGASDFRILIRRGKN